MSKLCLVSGSISGRTAFFIVLLVGLPAFTASDTHAQVADTVILRSGNPVIGEIQELRRGTLNFDTDEMGVVGVDWEDMIYLTSPRIFEVTDINGFQFFGRLAATDVPENLVVVLGEFADTLAFSQVVEIVYIGGGFLAKTTGFVDLGANLARANNLASLLFNSRFRFRGRLWDVDLTAESYFQRQETTTDVGDVFEETTSRNSSNIAFKRFFGGEWAATTGTGIEQNEELSLDRRIIITLGGEYHLVRNQSMALSVGLGAALNAETFTGEDRASSAEVTVLGNFDAFDIGDLNVSSMVTTFVAPGDGRIRLNIDGRVSWEIFGDFFLGFTVKESYDTKPPAGAEGRDFQYGLTIGWSWG